MRIVFVLTQSLDSPSGLGRYWPLARQLVRRGHSITILALHPEFSSLHRRRFAQDGVQVRYVGQMHVRKRGNTKIYYAPLKLLLVTIAATWHLAVAALREPADVYHLGKPHPMNGLAVLIAASIRRLPIYLDCDDYEAGSNRFGAAWQRKVVDFFERSLPRFAVGVTVNTQFTAARLRAQGYPAERIVYVPNGVDRDRFACARDLAAVEAARNAFDLGDSPVVAYVGSLSLVNHPIDLLLHAFACLRLREPDAVLLIAGGGEDYEHLVAEAEVLGLASAVRFTGRILPPQVPALYALARVSVDPVNADLAATGRAPLKIVESLAAGTPVVTGDIGDRRATLSYGGGLLVPAGDSAALAEAMVSVLTDDNLQARLAAETRVASEHFYWDILAQRFAQIYDLRG